MTPASAQNNHTKIIDGKAIAARLKEKMAKTIESFVRPPGLVVILVGNDAASQVYVNHKEKACKAVGFYSEKVLLKKDIRQDKLLQIIDKYNQQHNIDGILVQLPLPPHIDSHVILNSIDAAKDVAGFHPINAGLLMQNKSQLRPCTPKGVITLLDEMGIDLIGKYAVVIGASNIVGRPMAMELLNKRATVTICNSKTPDLAGKVKQADIVVAAVGIANLVKGDWIKPGAVVIDVGINRLDNGKLVGDVDFNNAKQHAAAITPVPGGVGPMTIATLLENTLFAYEMRHNQPSSSLS